MAQDTVRCDFIRLLERFYDEHGGAYSCEASIVSFLLGVLRVPNQTNTFVFAIRHVLESISSDALERSGFSTSSRRVIPWNETLDKVNANDYDPFSTNAVRKSLMDALHGFCEGRTRVYSFDLHIASSLMVILTFPGPEDMFVTLAMEGLMIICGQALSGNGEVCDAKSDAEEKMRANEKNAASVPTRTRAQTQTQMQTRPQSQSQSQTQSASQTQTQTQTQTQPRAQTQTDEREEMDPIKLLMKIDIQIETLKALMELPKESQSDAYEDVTLLALRGLMEIETLKSASQIDAKTRWEEREEMDRAERTREEINAKLKRYISDTKRSNVESDTQSGVWEEIVSSKSPTRTQTRTQSQTQSQTPAEVQTHPQTDEREPVYISKLTMMLETIARALNDLHSGNYRRADPSEVLAKMLSKQRSEGCERIVLFGLLEEILTEIGVEMGMETETETETEDCECVDTSTPPTQLEVWMQTGQWEDVVSSKPHVQTRTNLRPDVRTRTGEGATEIEIEFDTDIYTELDKRIPTPGEIDLAWISFDVGFSFFDRDPGYAFDILPGIPAIVLERFPELGYVVLSVNGFILDLFACCRSSRDKQYFYANGRVYRVTGRHVRSNRYVRSTQYAIDEASFKPHREANGPLDRERMNSHYYKCSVHYRNQVDSILNSLQ